MKIDPRYFRPAEVDLLLADPTKAKRKLGWKPKVTFPELVTRMVDADLELAAREKRARGSTRRHVLTIRTRPSRAAIPFVALRVSRRCSPNEAFVVDPGVVRLR